MEIYPWFYCKCGKLHTANYVNRNTVCTCGLNLWDQIPMRSTNAKGNIS